MTLARAVGDALDRMPTERVLMEFKEVQALGPDRASVSTGVANRTVDASVQPVPASASSWPSSGREVTRRARFYFRPVLDGKVPRWITRDEPEGGAVVPRRYSVVDSRVWSGYIVCTGELTG